MDCRYLVFTSLLVGLTVAPPPGPPHGPPTPGGPQISGPEVSYGSGVSSGSLNDEMQISGQPNQLEEQQYAYEFPAEGQPNQLEEQQWAYELPVEGPKQKVQNQGNNQQGQDFYQSSFKPQDGINIRAPVSQQYQALLQQNQALLQQNQAYKAYLKQQQGQKPYSSGFPQRIPSGASWGQGDQAQQDQQLGGFSGSFPGYGASPNGYMPQSTSGGGMGYLPGMYNHLPMVIAAPHDFTPFPTGYGLGAGSYGMPQVYGAGGQTYPQGSQGYEVGPASPSQGQNQFAQGQMTSNPPWAQFDDPPKAPTSPVPGPTSTQTVAATIK